MKRFGALFMALLLLLYIVLVGTRAVQLLLSGEPVGIAVGVALIVIPLIGAWALITEVRFGFRLERMWKILEAEGALPPELPAVREGRADQEAASESFAVAKAEVEADPESWRAWFKLSAAYDASRDRKRARSSARQAIQFWLADR
ncbi:hypothetical protein [Humidisolicoccus flavus]|uniref:hypothetical protein n=1 Tax=Humidisolicoccus flavus TaxID=3111414 RepID=UPI00324C94C9